MRSVAVIGIVLCTFASFCTRKDTNRAEEWPRTVEPRLTGVSKWEPCRELRRGPDRAVAEVRCATMNVRPAICDDIVSTHAEALQLLALHPHCNDAAISALERFARADPGAMSDVVAAYIVRAQREDRPSDLLRALEASEHAIAAAPKSPAAHFNRALAQEALGFTDEAIASWNAVIANDRSRYADEAKQHRDRLKRFVDGPTQWARNRQRLPTADARTIARLIEPFPSAALRYFEEEAPQSRLLASALSKRLANAPYAIDVANAIAQASPERRALLQQGHAAFREARFAEQTLGAKSAEAPYQKAAELLERGGSPMHLRAQLGYAVAVALAPDGRDRALALLDSIEREARLHGYRHLLMRVHWMRGYLLAIQSRYLEALSQYDSALTEAIRLRDAETIAAIHARQAGILRRAGDHELSWREVFRAVRYTSGIVEARGRLTLLGETAQTALALGHPRSALLYQNAAVRLYQRELVAVPPEDEVRIRGVQRHLAVALRGRAEIELRLERHARAVADLDESIRLLDDGAGQNGDIRRVLRARVLEVQGQSLLRTAPLRAAAAFTQSLQLTSADFHTFRASLFAQRAEAQRLAGRRVDAERDLRMALDGLRAEETRILEGRAKGEHEELWSAYFSRFRGTYDLLIQQLADDGRAAEAFAFSERARAFELLDLILQLQDAPEEFRKFAAGGTAQIPRIQAELPRGTFLIQYSVLEDRTYTWIISRDSFQLLRQRARRADVARWSAALQEAARQKSARNFDAGLYAPFDALLAAPLAAIEKMPDGRKPARLVFVPDGAMHGLPFSALRNPVTRRHLIEDAPVAIAGSTALYLFSLSRDRHLTPSTSALVIGDPAFDEELALGQGLHRLPGAQREAARIRELYGPRAELLTGPDATAPEFFARAAASAIVHVAAHAIANAQTPPRSSILLARSDDHSGVIEAKELLTKLNLHQTRLVVLSTCSSAGGLPVGPEGVAPLVRPLLAAGVPAVIGSLWDVEDATAEELLVSFHRHYRQGSDAAVALQTAQLDLLRNRNSGLRSVFAWAAFQVIGEASSPFATHAHHGGTPLGIHPQNSLQRLDRIRPE